MSRKILGVLAALSLLLALTIEIVSPIPANATSTSYSWPTSFGSVANIASHGDGSFTVINTKCSGLSSTTPMYAHYTPSGNLESTVQYDSGGWHTVPNCSQQWNGDERFAAGSDKTMYIVQQKDTSPYSQRLIAVRGSGMLWAKPFGAVCGSYYPAAFNPTVDYDGNIVVEVKGSGATCADHLYMKKLDSATGKEVFTVQLPSTTSPNFNNGLADREIMPYNGGIAVANGTSIYYYDSLSGTLDSSKTLTPPSGTSFRGYRTATSGRTFIMMNGTTTKLYYKDITSSTVNEISPVSGKQFVEPLNPTPTDGVVVRLLDSSSNNYIGYFDQNGTESYEKNLSSDSLGYMPSSTPTIVVDGAGNVIVTRLERLNASPNDQTIYVDSFDSSGNLTRLFDAAAEYGTTSRDVFTTTGRITQSLGNGNIYMGLCRETSGSAIGCPSYVTPSLVSVATPASFDYPRSEVFTTNAQQTSYVALGDSYSSGEGNPPFIAPTDNNGGNGCDRSQDNAFPVLLPPDTGMKLRAFVACSGATADEVFSGKNGEPNQLDVLGADSNVVTITAGGNDVGFSDFAAECVVGTCDSASSQYQTTMDKIDNYLQDNLELLYDRIRAAAPNATVVVVGYPDVVSFGSSCPSYISGGEEIAIETVITEINNKIRAAVYNQDASFQFIDPTMTGSPFEGHDLCSNDSYFFGLNIAEHRFSFHPNPNGQAAYEELIANLI